MIAHEQRGTIGSLLRAWLTENTTIATRAPERPP